MVKFRNTEYKNEWAQRICNEYANGACFEEGGRYAVYDGAQNFMGFVNKNGRFACNGAMTEYRASFLRTAKVELVRLGFVEDTEDEP